MSVFSAALLPALLCLAALWGLHKRVDVYGALVRGAEDGIATVIKILPALVGLLTAIYMLRASGALELATGALAPLLERIGIPAETAPLMLVRPMSGSGALAVGVELMKRYGPDSEIGRTAAVMLGASETTFYTIAVYFGGLGIRKTRYAIPAALCADLAGFLASAWAVRLFFGPR
ncbi:MAG TPA: nucleoside recognition domain-containing protein [Oscillospiraceae bacterium]|nr:nucleoside recognition domain-containing protein [Oscillospiraceae bacterium]